MTLVFEADPISVQILNIHRLEYEYHRGGYSRQTNVKASAKDAD